MLRYFFHSYYIFELNLHFYQTARAYQDLKLSRSFNMHTSMIANRYVVLTKLSRKFDMLLSSKSYTTEAKPNKDLRLKTPRNKKDICINNIAYKTDDWCNLTPRILSIIGRNLHLRTDHPICLIKEVWLELVIVINYYYLTELFHLNF